MRIGSWSSAPWRMAPRSSTTIIVHQARARGPACRPSRGNTRTEVANDAAAGTTAGRGRFPTRLLAGAAQCRGLGEAGQLQRAGAEAGARIVFDAAARAAVEGERQRAPRAQVHVVRVEVRDE